MKIKNRLYFISIPLVILFAALPLWFIIPWSGSILEDHYTNLINIIADLKSDKIQSYFEERQEDLLTLQNYFEIKKNLPVLTRFAEDSLQQNFRQATENLNNQLTIFYNTSHYRDIMLVNPEGMVVYAFNKKHRAQEIFKPLPSTEDINVFQEARNKITFSNVYFKEASDFPLNMLAAAPVYDAERKFLGEVVLEIHLQPLWELIQDTTGLGSTGETLLGKLEGNNCIFINPLRFNPTAAMNYKIPLGSSNAIPIQLALMGESGSGFFPDYRGQSVLAAWRNIAPLGWGLVAKIDRAEIEKPKVTFERFAILFYLGILSLLLGISLVMTRSITRPLKKIEEGIQQIGQGNFNTRIKVSSKDEFGLMAKAFNAMARKLQNTQQILVQKVTDLTHLEESLNRSNRALGLISKINGIINNADNEQALLDRVCQLIIESADYEVAWIGYPKPEPSEPIEIMATSGEKADAYLSHITVTWDESSTGNGPGGTAIRTGTSFVVQDIQNDPSFEPWKERAVDQGFQSCLALPLRIDQSVIGVLSIYSSNPNAFNKEEITLLEEMADNLAHGIHSLRDRVKKSRAEQVLKEREKELSTIIDNHPEALFTTDQDHRILLVNLAFEHMFGYTAENVIGHTTDLLCNDPNQIEECVKLQKQFLSKSDSSQTPLSLDIEYKRADGSSFIGATIVAPVINSKGQQVGIITTIRDITQLRAQEEEIRKLSAIAEKTDDIVFIAGQEGELQYTNQSFERVTGYTADEVRGKLISEVLKSGLTSDEFYEELWTTITAGKVFKSETLDRKKNGELFYYDQTITPIKDDKGNITHFISTGKDGTERVLQQKKLEETLEDLTQANKVKTLFLANVSHEIRTPLAGILGFSELIQSTFEGTSDPEKAFFFNAMREPGNRLLDTVEKILAITQWESGSMSVKPAPLNLNDILDQLADKYKPMAEAKGLSFNYLNATSSPANVMADEVTLKTALSNLLDNAIKFTPAGSVTLSINQQRNHFLVQIADTGIGIGEDHLKDLYSPFSQESTGYTKDFQGIGLGMAVAKRCLDANNIGIQVESTKGTGTKFTLTFERRKSSQKEVGSSIFKQSLKPKQAEKDITDLHILLVEDDPVFQNLIRSFFPNLKNFQMAESVNEAKNLLRQNRFDLILLDILLQGEKTGLDLIKFIRINNRWKTMPILAVTAYASPQDRQKCLAIGCNDYLVKPITRAELIAKIQSLI